MSHSAIVGGSTAGRVLACPGSVQATLQLPPSIDKPSAYAEEGTAMHKVMDALMTHRYRTGITQLDPVAESWIGNKSDGLTLTQEHIDTMIGPALNALHLLEYRYGGDFKVIAVEKRVAFPKLFDAFGTIDLIMSNGKVLLHIDWKFGGGVPVAALKDDVLNPQLMYYITASRYTTPILYRGMTCVGAIIQPRSETLPLSHAIVRKIDIKNYRAAMEQAVRTALRPQPPRSKGEHCRFAPCKINCPLWTGPLLELSLLELPANMPAAQSQDLKIKTEAKAYGEYLARCKALADLAAMFKTEVDEQMHAYLEAGGTIPGWRLKLKATKRQWVDESEVEQALKKLGFKATEIWQRKLVTFQSADSTARRKKVKIPDGLRVAPSTTDTTICPTDDPAPVVHRTLLVEQFRESLKLLQQETSR